jgi:hypothetical protein
LGLLGLQQREASVFAIETTEWGEDDNGYWIRAKALVGEKAVEVSLYSYADPKELCQADLERQLRLLLLALITRVEEKA